MAVSRADIQSGLDAELVAGIRLEMTQLFNGMFTGRRDAAEAMATFERGVADWRQTHAVASASISKLIPENAP